MLQNLLSLLSSNIDSYVSPLLISNISGVTQVTLQHADIQANQTETKKANCAQLRLIDAVAIDLALWESNYYRCLYAQIPEGPPQLRQVYLRYQDPLHRNTTFEVDDSTLTENGFTCCDTCPKAFSEKTFTLTSTNPLCLKVYFDSQANYRFSVGFGQCFGKGWIHVGSVESNIIHPPPWKYYTKYRYFEMLDNTAEYTQPMNKARSGSEGYGQIYVMQTRLPRTRVLQISFVMLNSSRMCGVKLEVFDDPSFCDVSGEWTAFDVDVGSFFPCLIGADITIYLGNRRSRL